MADSLKQRRGTKVDSQKAREKPKLANLLASGGAVLLPPNIALPVASDVGCGAYLEI